MTLTSSPLLHDTSALHQVTRGALRSLRLRHIELLSLLGHVPTVNAAAMQMHLSQPAVSKMVSELERICQTKLFTRGRRGIEATPQGTVLIRYANEMVGCLDRAQSEISTLDDGAAALLRIGSFSTTSVLPRLVTELFVQMPNVQVKIIECPPTDLVQMLLDGVLDCAISAFPRHLSVTPSITRLKVQPILSDRICVIASKKHKLAKYRRLAWTDLIAQRWALPPRDGILAEELNFNLAQLGCSPIVPVVESMSGAAISWLIRMNHDLLAAVRLPRAEDEIESGDIIMLPVRPFFDLPTLSLIAPRNSNIHPSLAVALDRAFSNVVASFTNVTSGAS